MKGRKPKPIELQMAEGDPRKHGKHKLEQRLAAIPKTSSGLPDCPRHLKGRARYAWKVWAEELAIMNLDKRPDGPMLEGACRAYQRAVEADLIVDKEGIIIQDKGFVVKKDGLGENKTMTVRTKQHPAVTISNNSWMLVKAFCSEFGLSPASRLRLTPSIPPDSKSDDLLKSLSDPRPSRLLTAVN